MTDIEVITEDACWAGTTDIKNVTRIVILDEVSYEDLDSEVEHAILAEEGRVVIVKKMRA
ncbi:MAG: hypothetical protein KKA68_21040 [Gammaproteobacteria bacterium]|nr:hypothetical protein [Gammaproteobacteria bacterium]